MKNFLLVKINYDNNLELAQMLNIQSVPTVYLVYKGNLVENFTGVPEENKLKSFFESINLLKDLGENENVMKSLLLGADEWMHKKQYDRAESMLTEAWSHQKLRHKYGHIVKMGLGIYMYIM